ncbi:hypothetical protein GCM10028832_00010 [Streptomyces sparsus]
MAPTFQNEAHEWERSHSWGGGSAARNQCSTGLPTHAGTPTPHQFTHSGTFSTPAGPTPNGTARTACSVTRPAMSGRHHDRRRPTHDG